MSNTSLDSLYKTVTSPSFNITAPTEKPIEWREPKYNYDLNNVYAVRRHADYNLPTYTEVVNTAPIPMGLKYKKYDDIPFKWLYRDPPTKVRNDKLKGHNLASIIMDKLTSGKSIYETDVKDTAKWLYKRKGHDLTDEQWEGILKARQSPRSALRPIPSNIYYFPSDRVSTGAASMLNEKSNSQEYIPFISMNSENPLNDFQGSPYEKINGYIRYIDDQSNARDLYAYHEILDHELSHAFNIGQYNNPVVAKPWEKGSKVVQWNKMLEHLPNNYSIFSGSLTPEQTSPFIKNEVHDLFNDTYIGLPQEYLGAMARIKRQAAGDGYDVFNEDDKIARDGMSRTLHRIATETNPEQLPYEMQRIHTWANTSFDNYFNIIQQQRDAIQNDPERREEFIRLDNILKNRKQMEQDPNSPLYQNILRYLTPETLRALVHNNPNTQSLNNIHLT